MPLQCCILSQRVTKGDIHTYIKKPGRWEESWWAASAIGLPLAWTLFNELPWCHQEPFIVTRPVWESPKFDLVCKIRRSRPGRRQHLSIIREFSLRWTARSMERSIFLAVQNSSIGDPVTHSLSHWLRVLLLLTFLDEMLLKFCIPGPTLT